MYDSIETHVHSLTNLDVASESYVILLTYVLLSKLPQELRLIVTWKTNDDELNLDILLKEVEQKIDARERPQATQVNPTSQQPNSQQPKKSYREPQNTAATLFQEILELSVVTANKHLMFALLLFKLKTGSKSYASLDSASDA